MVAKREGAGVVMEWNIAVDRYKLLYIRRINNKVLLYRTQTYTQYFMITIMEKNIKNRIMYMCN